MTVPVSQGVSVYTNVSVQRTSLRAPRHRHRRGTDASICTPVDVWPIYAVTPATAVHLRVTMRRHANVYRAAAARSGQGGPGRAPRASSGGGAPEPRPAMDHARPVACHPRFPA